MRGWWLLAAAVTATPAGANPRMAGFGALAAQGERIDLHGVPVFMDGGFRLGEDGTRGKVKRRANGRASGGGDMYDETRDVRRSGRISFTVAGAAAGGEMAGECRYGRGEWQERTGGVTVAGPAEPLFYRCTFTRAGTPAGELLLRAPIEPGDTMALQAERTGSVRWDGTELQLRSVHGYDGARGTVEAPVGYLLAAGDAPVGAIDLNNVGRKRLILPHDPAQRQAALAAGLALGLFWDPGDVDADD